MGMTFADKVSSVRIILIPVFVSLLIYSKTFPVLRIVALGVFILAVLSDFFDGLVARIKKEKSDLGQIIDPLADKLLLTTAFITLYLLHFNIYLWVVFIVVSRDMVILLGFTILHFLKIDVVIAPSIWGKLTTFFQMFTVIWALSGIPFYFFISFLAVFFTLISGINYFIRGVKAINGKTDNSNS
ncbi:MAG: CDP-alcohol phosphatidyltransferase family protein [Candidatus Omnitrophica bacterium]|nr:CDP-alcohol phosphatidyltransferase family protein [Candidatus Omnitrophota bacterium]MDD5429195.1 CDP-alcohol phosphatidyltransferase family protein [Candidatus Omnitrophota bacterium]